MIENASSTCARCGSPLEAGDLRCAVCAAPAPELEGAPSTAERVSAIVLRCASCDAALRYDARVRAPRCAFCGEAMRIEERADPLEEAGAYLPFRVDREAAGAALARWLGGLGTFRPSDLRSSARIESLQPSWWVAWVFDAHARVSWSADSEVGAGRSAWAPHSGVTTLAFDDVLVSASRGLSEEEALALFPSYELASARSDPAGAGEDASIEAFDAPRSQARSRVMAAVERQSIARVETECVPGRRKRNVHASGLLARLETRRIAFPAWVMAYRYRERLYRVVVSGQDAGVLLGRAPWSVAKIVLAVLAGLALAALIALAIAAA